ncbi:TusE/DsrC/DsvC family sulfur relay protein [Mobiluncus curtisii]|nr:TusE/DsrC/DsvC family sulfur relay protein [Mobiluncus curtisii]
MRLGMKNVVIIGGGTGGTVTANSLARRLDCKEFQITVIDYSTRHYYQPGFVALPFGKIPNPLLWRRRRQTLHPGIRFLQDKVTAVDPVAKIVATQAKQISYDYLVLATGCECRPELVEGMAKGTLLNTGIYSFYTLAWARRLRRALQTFTHGHLVVHISEFPIRCPVAPIEFALKADHYFFTHRVRDDIEITIVTPQSQVFEQSIAARNLSNLLRLRDIEVQPDFVVRHIDATEKRMYAYDGKAIDYDMLVTVPPMRGQQFIVDSELGDEMGFVHPDLETLQHREYPDIFAIGDTADLPTSKSGSACVYQSRVLVSNLLDYMAGRSMMRRYDGHAMCIIDTGYNQATVIDRSYTVPAVTGNWFFPRLGPLSLLKQTRRNHLAKRLLFVFYSAFMAGLRVFDRFSHIQLFGKEFRRWGLRPDGTTPLSAPDTTPDADSLIAPTWKRRPNACLAAAFSTKVLKIPVLHEAGGRSIDVDAEGFMTNPCQWTRAVGTDLARAINLEMTPRHWEVIEFARQSFVKYHVSPSLRRMEMAGHFPIAELFELFPSKPNKLICYVAGIPKPLGCI